MISLDLQRVKQLAARLDPFTRYTVHIAGTNGKGSVTTLVASILHASGLSVGKFNSPHLVSVYDSIVINNHPVSPSAYDHARSLVIAADQELGTGATPFELLTLTVLQIFEAAKVDIAVIEVGMGGRGDATNIIPDDCILVSILTAVGLDHQRFLGDTVESITEHKAGIARSGKPFILGAQKYPIVEVCARRIIEGPQIRGQVIRSLPVRPRHLDDPQEYYFTPSVRPFIQPPAQPIEFCSTSFPSPIHAKFPLYGTHQLDNLALALTVVSTLVSLGSPPPPGNLFGRITPETVCEGIENISWPGRLTFHTLPRPVKIGSACDPSVVLVDGAHNTASAEMLAFYISDLATRLKPGSILHITYIVGLSHSPPKTSFDTLSPILSPHVCENPATKVRLAALRFSPPEGMPWVACVPPSEIRGTVREIIHLEDKDIWAAPDDLPIDAHLRSAFEWTETGQADRAGEKLVVVTGSLYLVADFYRMLKMLED